MTAVTYRYICNKYSILQNKQSEISVLLEQPNLKQQCFCNNYAKNKLCARCNLFSSRENFKIPSKVRENSNCLILM